MIPIKYQVEESVIKYRPYGVTIRQLIKSKKWIICLEDDNSQVDIDGLVSYIGFSGELIDSQFNSPEEALVFWQSIRKEVFENYPELGWVVGYYTDKEARSQRKKIGWDHISKVIKKLEKADRKKNKKNKKSKV